MAVAWPGSIQAEPFGWDQRAPARRPGLPACATGGGHQTHHNRRRSRSWSLRTRTFSWAREMRLDDGAARRAINEAYVAKPLGLDLLTAASGILDVGNAGMIGAMRIVSVQRGYDPREFALVAFGGAGPLHANALAKELGIDVVTSFQPLPGWLRRPGCC